MRTALSDNRDVCSPADAPANYLFIMAASHSGSTLLCYLAASHPDAATIGETSGILRSLNVDEYPCSCGRLIRQCGFWQDVARAMNQRGLSFDLDDYGTRFAIPEHPLTNRVLKAEHRGPLLEAIRDAALGLSPAWHSRCSEISKRNEALAEVVREIHGVRLLVDSSKHPLRLKFLLRIASLSIKVVHLVRDGRGVALTYMEQEGWPMEKAALEWRRNVIASEKCVATLRPGQVMQVRYEDYCTSLEPTLKRLFAFAGLDPEAIRPNFRATGNHVVGNGMRLESTSAVTLDEQWRKVLTKPQLASFERVAGDVNDRYRYKKIPT